MHFGTLGRELIEEEIKNAKMLNCKDRPSCGRKAKEEKKLAATKL